jgi:hypothetical protein
MSVCSDRSPSGKRSDGWLVHDAASLFGAIGIGNARMMEQPIHRSCGFELDLDLDLRFHGRWPVKVSSSGVGVSVQRLTERNIR